MGATVCRRSSSCRRDYGRVGWKVWKWKTGLEDKRLRVNAAKTKVMISSSEIRSGFAIGR